MGEAVTVLTSVLAATATIAVEPTGLTIAGEPWWKFATIPLIAGIIGWGTNWLAIKMTFYPLEFVGLRPVLGWQGIIPSRSHKMASIATDQMMGKVGTVQDIMAEMEPRKIAQHVLATVVPQVPEMVNEVAEREYPRLWANTPPAVKEAVYDRARALLPRNFDRLVDQIEQNIGQLVDMRMMVVDQLTEHKALLNRVFQEAGAKEFRFLINSGLYFGFLLGLIQMGVQIWLNAFWVLPVFGIFVGYATNWLALKLIFNPVEEKRIGPVRLIAQFLKRKEEIAAYFARVTSREMLTIRHFVDRMLTGPQSDRTHQILLDNIRPLVDEAIGIARPAFQLAIGTREYDAIKHDLAAKAIQLGPVAFDDPAFVESRAVLVERTMFDRMVSMNNEQFTGLLRPVVEEDEWKLIAVGAFLGGLAGLAQATFVFGSSF